MYRLLLAALPILALASVARAETTSLPIVMTHEGYLLDGADQPISTTGLQLTFALFDTDAPTSSETKQWEAKCPVIVSKGRYAAMLGAGACLGDGLDTADLPLSAPRYLEVTIDGSKMLPRLRITPAPLAAMAGDAQRLGGQLPAVYSQRAELAAVGTVNTATNPLDWSQLKSVPEGFADGVDKDTTYDSGAGLVLEGATFKLASDAASLALVSGGKLSLDVDGQLTVTGAIVAPSITGGTVANAAHTAGTFATPAITGGTVANAAVTGGTLTNAAITGGTLTNAAITGGTLTNAAHTGGTFATPAITGGTIATATLTGSTLNGATINSSTLAGPTVTGTLTAAAANFSGAVGLGVTPVDAALHVNGNIRSQQLGYLAVPMPFWNMGMAGLTAPLAVGTTPVRLNFAGQNLTYASSCHNYGSFLDTNFTMARAAVYWQSDNGAGGPVAGDGLELYRYYYATPGDHLSKVSDLTIRATDGTRGPRWDWSPWMDLYSLCSNDVGALALRSKGAGARIYQVVLYLR